MTDAREELLEDIGLELGVYTRTVDKALTTARIAGLVVWELNARERKCIRREHAEWDRPGHFVPFFRAIVEALKNV